MLVQSEHYIWCAKINSFSQMPRYSRIQSIITVATYMFLSTGAIVDHTHKSSAVFVSYTNKRKTYKDLRAL